MGAYANPALLLGAAVWLFLGMTAAAASVFGSTVDGMLLKHLSSTKSSAQILSLEQRRTLVGMGQWNQLGDDIDGEAAGDNSGYFVKMSREGNIVAVGAPGNDGTYTNGGHIRVKRWDGSQWKQMGDDIDAIGEEDSPESGSRFTGEDLGEILSISGNGLRIAIGEPGYSFFSSTFDYRDDFYEDIDDVPPDFDFNDAYSDGNVGYLAVYDWNGMSWENTAFFQGVVENTSSRETCDRKGLGVSLSDSGNRLAIREREIVRIREKSGSTWGVLCSIDVDSFRGQFRSLSLSGDGKRVAFTTSVEEDVTRVEVHQESGSECSRVGGFIDIDGRVERMFLSFAGDRLAVAVREEDAPPRIHVYDLIGSDWQLVSDELIGLHFSMASDGKRFVVGSPPFEPNSAQGYELDGPSFMQVGDSITGEASGDFFGGASALSHSGERVAIGARENDGENGEDSGHVRVYELDSDMPPIGPFQNNFNQVVCSYFSCLGDLLPRYDARSFSNKTLDGYRTRSKWKAKQAKKIIEGGYPVRSLDRLKQSMKFIQKLNDPATGFAKTIGRNGTACAINLVDDFY